MLVEASYWTLFDFNYILLSATMSECFLKTTLDKFQSQFITAPQQPCTLAITKAIMAVSATARSAATILLPTFFLSVSGIQSVHKLDCILCLAALSFHSLLLRPHNHRAYVLLSSSFRLALCVFRKNSPTSSWLVRIKYCRSGFIGWIKEESFPLLFLHFCSLFFSCCGCRNVIQVADAFICRQSSQRALLQNAVIHSMKPSFRTSINSLDAFFAVELFLKLVIMAMAGCSLFLLFFLIHSILLKHTK